MAARFSYFLAVLAFLCAMPASAERRVAFVMGNGDYKHAIKLTNPASDAQAMTDLLKSMGFEVVSGTNLGRETMAEKMSEFARAAAGADVALFFYAGHGFQVAGKNLLVPVDADIKSEFDAKLRTIEIDQVLQDTMGDAKVKIVLLDACRDNPFAKQIAESAPKSRSVTVATGLAPMRSGEGTLIAFATAPGQAAADGEGRHSPFTRALLAHLGAPGVEVRHALTLVRAQVSDETRKQQLPWENTNLTGFYYLTKPAEASAPQSANQVPSQPAAGPSGVDPRMEIALWETVKASSNVEELKSYTEKYPNGTFADVARTRIASLSKGGGVSSAAAGATGEVVTAEASRATEDALGLDVPAWREIQTRLSSLGFGNRGVDGYAGPGTRQSLTAWQTARRYPATGYLNKPQRDALLNEPVTGIQAAQSGAASGGEAQTRGYAAPQGQYRAQRPVSGAGGNRAAGEFVGGVIRGMGGRLPF